MRCRSGWDSPDGRALVWAIAAAGVLLAIQQGVSPLLGVLGERISRRVDGLVRDRLAAASVGSATVAALEDQELLGHLGEAGGNLEFNPFTPGRAVSGLVALINRYVPVIAATVLIGVVFSWLAALRDPRRLDADPVRDAPRARGRERDVAREHVEPARGVVLPRASRSSRRPGRSCAIYGLVPWAQGRHRDAYERSWGTHWPLRRRLYTTLMGRYAVVGAALRRRRARRARRTPPRTGDVSLRDTAFVLQAGVIIVRVGAFFMESDLGTEFGMSAYQALGSFEEKAATRYAARRLRHPQRRGPAAASRSASRGCRSRIPGSERGRARRARPRDPGRRRRSRSSA